MSGTNLLGGPQTKNRPPESPGGKLSSKEMKILILLAEHTIEQITESKNFWIEHDKLHFSQNKFKMFNLCHVEQWIFFQEIQYAIIMGEVRLSGNYIRPLVI